MRTGMRVSGIASDLVHFRAEGIEGRAFTGGRSLFSIHVQGAISFIKFQHFAGRRKGTNADAGHEIMFLVKVKKGYAKLCKLCAAGREPVFRNVLGKFMWLHDSVSE